MYRDNFLCVPYLFAITVLRLVSLVMGTRLVSS